MFKPKYLFITKICWGVLRSCKTPNWKNQKGVVCVNSYCTLMIKVWAWHCGKTHERVKQEFKKVSIIYKLQFLCAIYHFRTTASSLIFMSLLFHLLFCATYAQLVKINCSGIKCVYTVQYNIYIYVCIRYRRSWVRIRVTPDKLLGSHLNELIYTLKRQNHKYEPSRGTRTCAIQPGYIWVW